jgi:hypothetical protein
MRSSEGAAKIVSSIVTDRGATTQLSPPRHLVATAGKTTSETSSPTFVSGKMREGASNKPSKLTKPTPEF